MKKIVLVAIVLLISFKMIAQPSRNYSDSDDKFAIKLNPLSLFLLTSNISFEYKIKNNLSAQLGVGYTGITVSSLKYEGIRLTPEVRFYTKQRAISGFYIAPYLRYQHYELSENANKLLYESFGGGLSFGFQKISPSGFIVDLFVGPSYNSGNFSVKEGTKTDENLGFGMSGTGIRTGLTIGFAF